METGIEDILYLTLREANMTAQQLKNSILQMAVQGKLVPQDPNDEPASVLLERIRAEKEKLIKEGKIKKEKNPSVIFRGEDNLPYEKVGKNEPVCIADEIPFEIPESWEWVRLKNLASVLGGKRIPAGRKLTTANTGHIYIRVSDMKNGSVLTDGLLYVPNDIFPSISRYIINKEDLYITVAGTIGAVGKIPQELDGANLTENADRLVFSFIDQDWFMQCLSSGLVQNQIADAITKVGQPKLAIKRIEELLIALPPYDEQKRIVDKIRELDPKIKMYGTKEDAVASLNNEFPNKLRKSVLQQAVMGKLVPQDENDEPASVLLDRIRAEKKALIKAGKLNKDKHESIIYRRDNSHYEKRDGQEICIDDEIPFEIPNTWEWARASSIGSMVRGKGIKRTETVPKGVPCVRYGEIYTSYNVSFSGTISFIDESLARNCLHFSTGDIIFTLTGENKVDIAKAVAYLGNETVAAGGDLAYWTAHGMNPLYLVYYMASPYCIERKRRTATGDIIVHISTDKVGSFLVPIPPLKEQDRIVEAISRAFSKLSAL